MNSSPPSRHELLTSSRVSAHKGVLEEGQHTTPLPGIHCKCHRNASILLFLFRCSIRSHHVTSLQTTPAPRQYQVASSLVLLPVSVLAPYLLLNPARSTTRTWGRREMFQISFQSLWSVAVCLDVSPSLDPARADINRVARDQLDIASGRSASASWYPSKVHVDTPCR